MISKDQNACLRRAAQEAQPEWDEYANYCLDRERGLRKFAFEHLAKFINNACTWHFAERRTFVDWICRLHLQFGSNAYGLAPQPL
ncbi:MAG TPA: hypothetical protein VEK08_07000 [Planctomycetota bacterium]|nr:hypothetical protein [Planctomycetota bacterium]